jgi:hypothetical protein
MKKYRQMVDVGWPTRQRKQGRPLNRQGAFSFCRQKEKSIVKHGWTVFLLTALLCLCFSAHGAASVEWETQKTLNLEKPPVDLAFSSDGRWVFILTEEGTVLIYSQDGQLHDKISVGENADGLEAGPREDILFVTSRKDKTVREISLDFIYDIDVSGSPFEGEQDAPVVVVVFNDYQ